MKKLLPLVMGFLVSLVGCKADKALNGNWETCSLIKDGVAQTIAVSNMEIQVNGSTLVVGGNSGVNSFHGMIKVDNGTLKPSDNFASTKMLGDPVANDFEVMFLDALLNAESYELDGNMLTIKSPSKNLELQFVKKN